MSTLRGYPELQRRFGALKADAAGDRIMLRASALMRGQMVVGMANVGARRSGMTGRSVRVENVTATSAQVYASRVALWIDRGTGLYGPKHQRITPTSKRALSWMGGPAAAFRLTGAVRKGKAGAGAFRITVRSTAGMKARPYIGRALLLTVQQVERELGAEIVGVWDSAA